MARDPVELANAALTALNFPRVRPAQAWYPWAGQGGVLGACHLLQEGLAVEGWSDLGGLQQHAQWSVMLHFEALPENSWPEATTGL